MCVCVFLNVSVVAYFIVSTVTSLSSSGVKNTKWILFEWDTKIQVFPMIKHAMEYKNVDLGCNIVKILYGNKIQCINERIRGFKHKYNFSSAFLTICI